MKDFSLANRELIKNDNIDSHENTDDGDDDDDDDGFIRFP